MPASTPAGRPSRCAGAAILFPALWYLFRTFKGGVTFGPLERE